MNTTPVLATEPPKEQPNDPGMSEFRRKNQFQFDLVVKLQFGDGTAIVYSDLLVSHAKGRP